jgi:DNA-binding NarL/FixJ family response regulator
MNVPRIPVAIVDDHTLYREILTLVVNQYPPYKVELTASNGKELLMQLATSLSPAIIILDINMPEMNGIDTLLAVRKKIPAVKVLAISGYSNPVDVAQMKQAGANGFLAKTAAAEQVKEALHQVYQNGRYFPVIPKNLFEGKDFSSKHASTLPRISQNELVFMEYLGKGLSYKEIATQMNLSKYTIYDYRDRLFNKLQVQSKSALIIQAIRLKLIDVNNSPL